MYSHGDLTQVPVVLLLPCGPSRHFMHKVHRPSWREIPIRMKLKGINLCFTFFLLILHILHHLFDATHLFIHSHPPSALLHQGLRRWWAGGVDEGIPATHATTICLTDNGDSCLLPITLVLSLHHHQPPGSYTVLPPEETKSVFCVLQLVSREGQLLSGGDCKGGGLRGSPLTRPHCHLTDECGNSSLTFQLHAWLSHIWNDSDSSVSLPWSGTGPSVPRLQLLGGHGQISCS